MKQRFRKHRFGPEGLALVEASNKIIGEYLSQGLRLTLRQLYYQLVVANILPNVERSYKKLSSLLSDARLAGLVDWEAIEDRIRQPRSPGEFANLGELVDAALRSYRLPRWEGQKHYIELWVEKDALAGILAPLAREYHVTMMVNRGYISQSAMYDAAERFREASKRHKFMTLLYLGDHDPSGEDMVRDIEERFRMFGVGVPVMKIALTMEQVEAYGPPPNPAKMTDPRASGYVAKHGDESWEVDALPPKVLDTLIRDHVETFRQERKYKQVIAREKRDRAVLKQTLAAITREDART